MSEDDVNFGDIVKAVAVVAGAFALQSGINSLTAPKAEARSFDYSVKQTTPACTILIGDYFRVAPVWATDLVDGDVSGRVWLINDDRLDRIDRYYLGDYKATLDVDGRVTEVNDGEGDQPYTDDPDPRVIIKTRLGAATETAYSEFVARWPSQWTVNHRGDGTGTAAVLCYAPQAKFLNDIFPFGVPQLAVAARGVCYDWRDVSQARLLPETWKWSASPVVWLVHLEWYRWGLDWARQIEPNLAALTVEANICDEPVALGAGGTEPRYRLAGAYRDNEDWDSVRKRILAVMDGWRTLDGRGRLVVRAGKYRAPTVTLRASDIVGVDWSTGMRTERRVDRLQVFFTNPAAEYVKDQCADRVIEEDGTQVDDFFPEWCYSYTQAERLARRFAFRLRPAGQGSISTNIGGLKCWGQREVRIQNDLNPDMADIVVEIPDGVEMSGLDGFSFAARQVDSSIDAWVPAVDEGPAPTEVVRGGTAGLPAPTLISAVPTFAAITSSGGLGTRFIIKASGPSRGDLTWYWRWRRAGGGTWTIGEAGDVTDTPVTFETEPTEVAPSIEVAVAYSIGSGTLSPWSTALTVDVTATTYFFDFSNYLHSGYAATIL